VDALPLLGGDEVRKLLDPAQLRVALADGFVALSKGNVDVPPRIGARAPRGLLGAMPGYVPGAGLVVKVVSVFPAGPGPTHQGLVVLFDEHDGTPLAALAGAAVTELRTAAAAALAADLLARPDAAVLTVVGTGVQARGHLAAFGAAPVARDPAGRPQPGAGRAPRRGAPGGDAPRDTRAAVSGADVVALCTSAVAPVVERGWLAPGAHLSSVGSGPELPAEVLAETRLAVEWRGAAAEPPPRVRPSCRAPIPPGWSSWERSSRGPPPVAATPARSPSTSRPGTPSRTPSPPG
jgi:alanine dehydrogenase